MGEINKHVPDVIALGPAGLPNDIGGVITFCVPTMPNG